MSAGSATLRTHLTSIRRRLSAAGAANAEQEARWLLCDGLRLSSAELLAHPEREVVLPEALEAGIRRREAGEPLQYVLGTADFWGRDFRVGPGVLVPRGDTEVLVRAALDIFPQDAPFTFLDWGTGSACIAATLLLERPLARGILAERSPDARKWAAENLARWDLSSRAHLLPTDAPEDIAVRGECDLLISNPPYVPRGAIPHLMREVRDHEPHLALDGGEDGMDCYRALLASAPAWLKPGAFVVLETGGSDQARAIRDVAERSPDRVFSFLQGIEDDSAILRCVVLKYRG